MASVCILLFTNYTKASFARQSAEYCSSQPFGEKICISKYRSFTYHGRLYKTPRVSLRDVGLQDSSSTASLIYAPKDIDLSAANSSSCGMHSLWQRSDRLPLIGDCVVPKTQRHMNKPRCHGDWHVATAKSENRNLCKHLFQPHHDTAVQTVDVINVSSSYSKSNPEKRLREGKEGERNRKSIFYVCLFKPDYIAVERNPGFLFF